MKRKVIALSGAQCSGKTTLFEALEKDTRFDGWHFYTSSSRKIAKKRKLKPSQEATAEFEKLVAQDYIDKHCADEKPYITDRCILDNAVYADWKRIYKGVDKETDTFCEETFLQLIPLVSVLFYCEHLPLVEDGVRSTDEKYRDDIVRLFEKRLKLAEQLGVKVVHLWGSIEERLNTFHEECFKLGIFPYHE